MTAVHALGEEDVAAAAALEAAAFGAGHRPAEACAAALREELTRPWARLWGARHDGALVAFLLAWHVVDELHVLNVATHPDAQRRGHGGRVLSAALAYAREHHVRLVLLEVRWSNRPAIGLYRRFGFYALARRRGYYPDGEDALEMALELDASSGQPVPHEDEVSGAG